MNKTRVMQAVALALVMAGLLSCTSNHAPGVPAVPNGPEYCLRDTVYTFQAVATDPEGDSVAVRFDWGDSTVSHWEGWFASGETVAFTHAWSDTGTYEVRVSAQDRQRTSALSEGHSVQVGIRLPPDTPGEPSGPVTGGTDTVYYFMAGADHPDWQSVAIRFAWGDGDTSDWSDFVLPGGPVEMSHAWSVPNTYQVRAQARDTFGLTSHWSEPHSVGIRPTGWSQLRMVGAPMLLPDNSGFIIRVINEGTIGDTVNLLEFFDTPESAYMRDFVVGADHGTGYPIPNGMPGTGPGDTVHFEEPVVIAPNGTQLVELYFADFYLDELGNDVRANVAGKVFVFRFDDGSEITVNP